MNQVTTPKTKAVARPLRQLVPLIKKDLEQGKDAADRAAMPYYRAAGEKMLEAKQQIPHGEFVEWIKHNFKIGKTQATRYMALAKSSEARGFSSIASFEREVLKREPFGRGPSWQEPVKQIVNKVDTEMLNRRAAEMAKAEERKAQHQLAIQLIDIGYRVLAAKLHPDKGGSRAAMARLNEVRDRLKRLI